MSGWLGSNWILVVAYALAGAAALRAGTQEHRRARTDVDVWPAFWFIVAGLFLMVAVARAAHLGGSLTKFGRHEARLQGWYVHRRRVQVIAIGLIAATALIAALVAVLIGRARRRRYVPAALVVFGLICFLGIRVVSLHQVDGLLYRRHLAGVRVGAILEVIALLVAIALTFRQPCPPAAPNPGSSPLPVEADSPPASV